MKKNKIWLTFKYKADEKFKTNMSRIEDAINMTLKLILNLMVIFLKTDLRYVGPKCWDNGWLSAIGRLPQFNRLLSELENCYQRQTQYWLFSQKLLAKLSSKLMAKGMSKLFVNSQLNSVSPSHSMPSLPSSQSNEILSGMYP